MTCTVKRQWGSTLTPDWAHVEKDTRRKSIFRRVGDDVHCGLLESIRPTQHFITGSSYEGFWDSLGFSGQGTYVYPHGAVYQGNFKDGQFHGRGNILYPQGHKLKGLWENGKLIDKIYVFADGLQVNDPWHYCQMPDRRFQTELNLSLRGAGVEYLTNRQPTVEIPEHCYDTIDGFYDPNLKCVFKYDEEALQKGEPPNNQKSVDTLNRICRHEECTRIEKLYRKAKIDPMEYKPDLYERWTTGIKADIEKIKAEHQASIKIEQENRTTIEESRKNYEKYVEIEYGADEPSVKLIYQKLK